VSLPNHQLVLGLLWFLLLLSCGQAPEAGELPAAKPMTVAAPPAVTTLPPPLLVTVTPTAPQQIFALVQPSAGVVSTATAPVQEAVGSANPVPALGAPEPAPAVPAGATAEAAAPPTFTPPPQPLRPSSQAWDHFWLRRPVRDGVVWTDKYYPYGSTRGGALRPHHGVEFNVNYSTEILAAAAGTVRVAGDDRLAAIGPTTNFYGNVVVIEHDFLFEGQPVFTLYAHLSYVLVQVGQTVQAHDLLALSGASGLADGPHVHFEVRVGENSYDATRNPLLWLYPFPDRGVVAGRVTWPGGALVQEAPLSLRRLDAPSAYASTTTYAGATVHGDDNWRENFAFDDVVAGYYELVLNAGEKKYTTEFWVTPYQTTFVELVLE
jgi:murein DD-endopeptidase MepM/ murein hydrolase activator NlpD